jgi:hypothetical protein
MTSTPKPRELPLLLRLNSEPETILRRFPFQIEGSQGMGRVRQSRVCPLLDTHRRFEVSTLKVFNGGLRTERFIVTSSISYSARRERRADRASAAFYKGQETGSNEILEKRCALVAYPFITPLTGFHRQGYEWT